MKRYLLTLPVVCAFALASCGGSNAGENLANSASRYLDSMNKADSLAKYGPATAVNWNGLLDKQYDGKRVIIEGYVRVPALSFSTIDLFERPNQMAGTHVTVKIENKSGNNSMKELKDGFSLEDIQITGKGGEAIGYGQRIRVTGELSVYDDYASLDAQEIEKIDAAAVDYTTLGATELGANYKDESMEGKFVFVDGMLEVPLTNYGDPTKITVWMEAKGIDETIFIDIPVGTAPGNIEPLPSSYQESDFKIHSKDGSVISFKKKVRVYGTIGYAGRLHVEGIDNI